MKQAPALEYCKDLKTNLLYITQECQSRLEQLTTILDRIVAKISSPPVGFSFLIP